MGNFLASRFFHARFYVAFFEVSHLASCVSLFENIDIAIASRFLKIDFQHLWYVVNTRSICTELTIILFNNPGINRYAMVVEISAVSLTVHVNRKLLSL